MFEGNRIAEDRFADVLNTVVAQDIQGHRSQSGHDGGVGANAAGVFTKSNVAHMMLCFNSPVPANGGAEFDGG